MARFLSPAETAAALRVSVKALRVYEAAGLVSPRRTEAGWRVYGPDELARLHQVLVLKSLGLPLARIAELLRARLADLDAVLALQETVLRRRANQTRLALSSLARAREPIYRKRFTPAELARLRETFSEPGSGWDQDGFTRAWDAILDEARALMASQDTTSQRARELLRRWRFMVGRFTGGDPELSRKASQVWKDAMADPAVAPRLPMDQELLGFVQRMALAQRGEDEAG